jgi:hypothetical protein
MKHVTLVATVIALSVAATGSSMINAAEPVNPKAVAITLPDQIQWTRSAAGADVAVMYGDPAKPGLYVVLNRWTPGNMSRPHWHPNDRVITVLKGTWWVGSNDKFDPDSTVPVPPGSVVTHFGKEVHYDGAKDEETVLMIVGEGPANGGPASTRPAH